MDLRSVVALAALAVAAPGMSAKPIVYAQPTDKWVVDFADNRCIAVREYQTAYGQTALYIKPGVIGDRTDLMVMFSADKKDDQARSVLRLSWNGVRDERNVSFQIYKQDGDKRLLVTSFLRKKLGAGSPKVFLDLSSSTDMAFEIADWGNVSKVIDECLTDLRSSLGISDELLASIAEPGKADDPTMMFRETDFPKEDIQRRYMGQATALYWVDKVGRVRKCTILESSGSPSIDATVCARITLAKFQPARDHNGLAIDAPALQTVVFQFPSR